MRMPFPNISSMLALSSHMYICYEHVANNYQLVKCQTFKNTFYTLKHKIIEPGNIKRNPFKHRTLIDCDKLFKLNGLVIPDSLLTTNRRDICAELFSKVDNEIQSDGYESEIMKRELVKSVNPGINLT